MNKRTVSVIAGTAAAALVGLVALAGPALAKDTAWNPTAPNFAQTTRIIGAPSVGGAGTNRIIG